MFRILDGDGREYRPAAAGGAQRAIPAGQAAPR